MYLKKAKYLENVYPMEEGVSVIITAAIHNSNGNPIGVPVGTPGIVYLKPFHTRPVYDSFVPVYGKNSRVKKEKSSTVCAKDLYAMDIPEANKLIYRYVPKTKVLFVFNTTPGQNDFLLSNVSSSKIYFDGKKPMLADNFARYDLRRLSDVHNKGDLKNFAEMTYDALSNNRYVNYTFVDVAKSNKKYMMEDINLIFNNLRKVYKHNVSFFQSMLENNRLRSLLDIVSISFYRLADATAIFDSTKAVGMVAEVFMTNSLCTINDMKVGGKSLTYRFFFSSSNENIFTLDGSRIRRLGDCTTDRAIQYIHKSLNQDVPNDEVLKERKAGRR